MSTDLILPISIVFGLFNFILISRWYVMPWVRTRSRTESLPPLLLLHSFRYIGMAFLIHGVTAEPLDTRFANPAAYGDFLAALLALLAIAGLKGQWTIATPLVWVFNLVGSLDLLNALAQGVQFVPNGDFGAMYFIPAIIVPALLVSHGIIFLILLKGTTIEQSNG
jgi:hypothetical protein